MSNGQTLPRFLMLFFLCMYLKTVGSNSGALLVWTLSAPHVPVWLRGQKCHRFEASALLQLYSYHSLHIYVSFKKPDCNSGWLLEFLSWSLDLRWVKNMLSTQILLHHCRLDLQIGISFVPDGCRFLETASNFGTAWVSSSSGDPAQPF